MLYGTITEFCTDKSCPVMNAGSKFEYLWADNNTKKPIKCSAPAYVDYLMSWAQDQIDDDSIFPSKIGVPFPKNFQEIAKTILKVTGPPPFWEGTWNNDDGDNNDENSNTDDNNNHDVSNHHDDNNNHDDNRNKDDNSK